VIEANSQEAVDLVSKDGFYSVVYDVLDSKEMQIIGYFNLFEFCSVDVNSVGA
jgi:hypothetical protein